MPTSSEALANRLRQSASLVPCRLALRASGRVRATGIVVAVASGSQSHSLARLSPCQCRGKRRGFHALSLLGHGPRRLARRRILHHAHASEGEGSGEAVGSYGPPLHPHPASRKMEVCLPPPRRPSCTHIVVCLPCLRVGDGLPRRSRPSSSGSRGGRSRLHRRCASRPLPCDCSNRREGNGRGGSGS